MADVQTAEQIPSPPNISQNPADAPQSNGSTATDLTDFAKPMGTRKRRRSSKPTSTRETRATPAPISSKTTQAPTLPPQPLTGATAVLDEQRARANEEAIESRQTSPNPARKTLENLLAATNSHMSKINDGPDSSSTLSKPLAEVASSIDVVPQTQGRDTGQISPQSTASDTTWEKIPATLTMSNGIAVASPGRMDDMPADGDESPRQSERGGKVEGLYEEENRSNKAFTYPGPMTMQIQRTSSLPQAGYGRDNTSSAVKRHKCPYCNTDFTRHHNLKSHLLTHSQEKPYNCDRCESRFRRLHDLKRHAKLHTGERPHVCPKCDRSFARGDALARHNKGQGGCAGRRESMGSFGGEDRQDDSARTGEGDSMPGILYTGEASHEPEHMDEDAESPAGRSLPSIRKHEAPPDPQRRLSDHQNLFHTRQPSTYPPAVTRQPATGSLYPPVPVMSPRAGSGASTTQSSVHPYQQPSSGTSTYASSAPNVLAQGGNITESPKPLSPGGMAAHQLGHADTSIHRNRSPSITQQLQQQQFRRATGNNTSPPMNLPPPHQTNSMSNAPHLPPLQGLTPPDPRYTLHSQSTGSSQLPHPSSSSLPAPPHGPGSPSYPPGNASSANNSLSSHSTGPHPSLDRNNTYGSPSSDRLWAYVDSLASKVSRLEDEVASLRAQTGTQPPLR